MILRTSGLARTWVWRTQTKKWTALQKGKLQKDNLHNLYAAHLSDLARYMVKCCDKSQRNGCCDSAEIWIQACNQGEGLAAAGCYTA